MTEIDLMNEIENATERIPSYETWGQCNISTFEVYWAKGSQPVAFDATIHPKDKRTVRIEIVVIPLDEMQARFNTEFKTTATSHDWAAVTLPSIKALNVPVASLKDAWVKVERKPNGKKYAKKDRVTGVPTGEMGDLTDFLFRAVFESQDACLADYLGGGVEPMTQASADAFPVSAPVEAAPPNAMIMQFAQALVTGAVTKLGKDLPAVSENVRAQIETSPFFGGKKLVELPEIMAMIMTACA